MHAFNARCVQLVLTPLVLICEYHALGIDSGGEVRKGKGIEVGLTTSHSYGERELDIFKFEYEIPVWFDQIFSCIHHEGILVLFYLRI